MTSAVLEHNHREVGLHIDAELIESIGEGMSFSVDELGEDALAPRLREQLPRPVEGLAAGVSSDGIRTVNTRPRVPDGR
jgi:hypothetical protein